MTNEVIMNEQYINEQLEQTPEQMPEQTPEQILEQTPEQTPEQTLEQTPENEQKPLKPKAIDFSKVEALRRHMLLTQGDMADLLGVTRAAYSAWKKKPPVRFSKKQKHAQVMLKKLLDVVKNHGWPMPEIIAADQATRKARLLALLEPLNN